MSSFSERLTSERNRLGISQADCAKAGGVARSAQANYEAGSRSPDAVYLAHVAEAGMDVNFLVTGTRAGGIDGTLLGACELALRQAFLGARPGVREVGIVRLSALAKVYNDAQKRLINAGDKFEEAARAAADNYIAWLNDPTDPALLERALFREATAPHSAAVHVSADRGSVAAGRDALVDKGK